MKVEVAGSMTAEIGVVRTPSGNFQTACKVTYSDGRSEEHRGKMFATLEEAQENADRLSEALRETQRGCVASEKTSKGVLS